MSADEVKEQAEEEKDKNTIEVVLPELERPLEKMTVKELREIGLKIPSLVGVHGMKKAELVEQLKDVYGISEETRTSVEQIGEIKQQIKDLRQQKAEAREGGEKNRVNVLRRKINRLKKKTRKLALAAQAAA